MKPKHVTAYEVRFIGWHDGKARAFRYYTRHHAEQYACALLGYVNACHVVELTELLP